MYDENVRLAREIPGSAIYLAKTLSDRLGDVTDIVTRTLGLARISVTLDKLSIYASGGFFTTHKDTPRVRSMASYICLK